MKRPRHRGIFLFALGTILFLPKVLYDCGSFLTQTLFIAPDGPDFPRENFFRGELGILQPTFRREYLVVAFRYLNGLGLDSTEIESFFPNVQPPRGLEETPLNIWYAARNRVVGPGPHPPINVYRQVRHTSPQFYFSEYLNCPDDAFLTAAGTLDARIKRFGAGGSGVKDWVQSQDQVFSNCSGPPNIPSPGSPNTPRLFQADRAYQIAAANFYAGNYDTAQKEFEEISKDPSSPWTGIAPYLVARTLIRKATTNFPADSPDQATLSLAEAQIKTILKDKRRASIHAAAERLLQFVEIRLDPEKELLKLSRSISSKQPAKALSADVHDYLFLLSTIRRRAAVHIDPSYPSDDQIFARLSSLRSESELTDWITTFQTNSPRARDHSLQKWEVSHSLPWLVAALGKINATHPKKMELIQAADRIDPQSPAFDSLAYDSLRLVLEAGDRQEALRRLNVLLTQNRSRLPASTRNMLFALRMSFANSLDEFLTYAQRVSVASSYWGFSDRSGSADNRQVFFDADSTQVLNTEMPLRLLAVASQNKILPSHLRRELAMGTWVRSFLLEDDKISAEMTPVVKDLAPELKDALEVYESAQGADGRKFAAAYLLLKFPGMRPFFTPGVLRKAALGQIDEFRDNWWCPLNPSASTQGGYYLGFSNYYDMKSTLAEPLRTLYQDTHLNAANFLKAQEFSNGQKEWNRLASLPTAPNYLSRIVIAWAKSHREDPHVPEALSLSVRSTRVGCVNQDTSPFSREAFELLHHRYPQSEWAKGTKYWYKY